MPTGYTAALESKKYDVKAWLKENIVRNFGVCMGLRDEGDINQKGIIDHLRGLFKEESYHVKRLREAREDLEIFSNTTPNQLARKYELALSKATSDYEARIAEFKHKKMCHIKAMADVTMMYNRAVDENQNELTVNALKFAVSQLTEAYQFDYGHEPYKEDVIDQSNEQWHAAKLKDAQKDVEYHSIKLKEETDRAAKNEHAKMYEEYVAFVDGFKK